MRKFFSLIAAVLFAGSMFAADVVGTINFGSAEGSTAVNAVSVTGNDSQKVQWTVTTTFGGETSFTQNAAYSQIGSSKKPASTITFTATLPAEQTIKAFSAKFGGFSSTAGNVSLKVGDTEVGTGALDATNDVLVEATKQATGTVLTVSVTGIAKGVKAYYISYTYDDGSAPTPVVEYYVVGTMNNWALDAAYKLAENPGQAGEYMKRFTFAANDELKVRKAIDGVLDAWYPEGVDNNWVINEAGQYDVYFRPEGNDAWANHYFYVAPYVIPQYEVAEAIAAGLTNGTEIKVRGVVSKMEIKGKNFANYGSACIYVSDATDQAGEFEFYNCYAIGSAKFTTTVPAYDATSTTWTQLTEVATADGYAIHVGDTVIAQGNYKLYNTTYELDQNCFIIYAKAPDAKYPTNIENAATEQKAIKTIENGKLVIIKNGVRYDALGTRL